MPGKMQANQTSLQIRRFAILPTQRKTTNPQPG
jgi:hypothetical protein